MMTLTLRVLTMDLLMGLAGLTGVAALLQSKIVPSQKDYNDALTKLAIKPDDPSANLTAGKYKIFVEGDYQFGLPYLAKGSDKTLATLAQNELDPAKTSTPPLKVGMGDEWVLAARKFPALSTQFYDRASDWYVQAWPDLDPVWKAKAREQGAKLAISRPQGGPRKGLPTGWMSDMGAPVLDGVISRSGSYSIKLPGDPKTETFLKSDPIPIAGNQIDYSALIRGDGTNSPNDQLFLNYFDKDGKLVGVAGVSAPIDTPFWVLVSGKSMPPIGAANVRVGLAMRSTKGSLWIDDASLKIDQKELLKNRSFEER